jgi:uncharacterized membrane protein YhiD involved in acid resistance
MIEKSLAAIILTLCVLMIVRMLLRPAQRARVDLVQRIAHRPRISRADAERQAREAIERAARKKKNLH